jgi:carbamoyltransferase
MKKTTGYILGISRGHNAGVCLLKDGEIIFSIEEERLSRFKYDGSPLAGIKKVLDYTDKVDYIIIAHTQPLAGAGKIEYTGDDMYTGLARKFGLIDRKLDRMNHPQVIDVSNQHHKIHASAAFYRSGFKDATAVVVDGAGSEHPFNNESLWEVESVFKCSYETGITTTFKHLACRNPIANMYVRNTKFDFFDEPDSAIECVITDHAGIVKCYEAVTEYCGFSAIEAGKTMGLFPYGNQTDNLPALFQQDMKFPISNRNIVIPTYPNSAILNSAMYEALEEWPANEKIDFTTMQNRRDAAYWIQTQTQQAVLDFIIKAVEKTGTKNVVLSGGYGLNCVANYFYLTKLNELGINLYVEPVSNDCGTAIGAALFWYHLTEQNKTQRTRAGTLYLGPMHNYTLKYIENAVHNMEGKITDCTIADIVTLLRNKNIVTIFQGRSENGPRALGNRSILFDPTFEDGKDYVNRVKDREYFRPFAGTILEEHVHEWFDLRGMENSPHMMYAVNCQPGVAEKLPSIIHEDGTCRIQTVTQEENKHFYNLIEAFYKKTGIPVLFNTSFNLGGEPLVETIEDALWTLENSLIEYLYLPEYNKLVTIKNG